MSTRVSRRRFLIGGSAAAAAIAFPTVALAARRDEKIAALAEKLRAGREGMAFSFALGRGGEIVYAAAFGPADAGTGIAATVDHQFRIASVSKPITAAAVMLLIERGKLSLDDHVFGDGGILHARFPVPPDAPHRDWLEAITVDHLLTHSCGGWTNDRDDPMFLYPWAARDALITVTLANEPLVRPPGRKYAYSNFAYCLLGRVIEVASDTPYEQFVRTEILRPAGAGLMYIGQSEETGLGPNEVHYLAQPNGFSPYHLLLQRMDSNGGWVASATDLVKFGMAVDGGKARPDVISAASVATMRRPGPASSEYGRGWGISPRHKNRAHTGSLPGVSTILALTPGEVAFAGLLNYRDDTSLGDLHATVWKINGLLVG